MIDTTQNKAQWLAWNAAQRGLIPKAGRCQQCASNTNLDAHHPDYNKPLVVVWLCRRCHQRHHNPTTWLLRWLDGNTQHRTRYTKGYDPEIFITDADVHFQVTRDIDTLCRIHINTRKLGATNKSYNF